MAEVIRRTVRLGKVVLLGGGYGDADRCCLTLRLCLMGQCRWRSLGEESVVGQAPDLPSSMWPSGCEVCAQAVVLIHGGRLKHTKRLGA